MKKIKKAINAPKGFVSGGVHSGVKKRRADIAIIYSETPCNVAGTFTKNLVKGAPVIVSKDIIEKGHKVHGVVINSGNANTCTGEQGMKDAKAMAERAQSSIGAPKDSILVASTGVIGVKLPMEKILNGIKRAATVLSDSEKAAGHCAEGIMTTDTFPKGIAYEFELGGNDKTTVKIGAIAKGSGMIHPNMATMLGFITTDCNISRELLDCALKEVINTTFNMISVDGDTSTNDMVLILANGEAKNPLIDTRNEDYETFKNVLNAVNQHLAKQIVLDGEGATKFIEANISGAKTYDDAKMIAKTIITSSLVKTAFFGEDANWGRIIAAMGRSCAYFDPMNVKIELQSCADEHMEAKDTIVVMEKGAPADFGEEEAHEILKNKFIKINITLSDGDSSAVAWGCDLSYEYVRINGEYRT